MAKQTTAAVRLNPAELKDIVKYIYKNNVELQNEGKDPIALDIVGPAGVSKTSCIEQVAEELGVEFVKLSVAQLEDPSDKL